MPEMTITLLHGDCLIEMDKILDHSVDAIIADWPYGTTECKWDTMIPFALMWNQCKRVIKPKGAIVLFGSQPFTSVLVMSNVKWFKYCWYWKKSKPNGWQNAKNKPMTVIEDICVFSHAPMGHISLLGKNRMVYNPQGIRSAGLKTVTSVSHGRMMGARPNQTGKEYESFTGFPHNMLEYPNVNGRQALHPTQKPVALLEYLIRTYTNEGEIVLDNTMGSGSTGVACVRTGRSFIGIEMLPVKMGDPDYFGIAAQRIQATQNEMQQLSLGV